MCLAIPMKLIEISDAENGSAEVEGVRYQVNLSLLEDVKVGDYVIVHAGFAIEKLDQEEANQRLAMFQELAANNAVPES